MIAFVVFAVGMGVLLMLPARSRWFAPGFATVMLGTLTLSVLATGWPRPHALGFPDTITVVDVQFIPHETIWLWSDEPVAYELPWDDKLAAQLMEREAEIEETGQAGFDVELGWSYGGVSVLDEPPMREPDK